MRFMRLLIVVLAVTLCGGAFGGVVGGLIGYALPTTLDAFFQTQGAALQSDAARTAETTDGSLRLGFNAESKALTGAALGGAWGLILGAVIGLILGTLDQFLLAINRWMDARREGAVTSGDAARRRPV